MSGSISGLLGLIDQAQQQPNAVQQPPVAGLLGNATQLLPTDPFAAGRAAAAAQGPAPVAPPYQTPRAATDAWSAAQDNAVYGAGDPKTRGMQGTAGFPMWSDPRMQQDHLAQLAMGTISTPGVDPQDARDELLRRISGMGGGGGSGAVGPPGGYETPGR